MVGVPVVVRVP